MTNAPGNDALDGLKVDQRGNVYSTGPGGLWIISPEGKQLGLIKGPEDPHNMAWGDDDGKTLYITALTGIYRMQDEHCWGPAMNDPYLTTHWRLSRCSVCSVAQCNGRGRNCPCDHHQPRSSIRSTRPERSQAGKDCRRVHLGRRAGLGQTGWVFALLGHSGERVYKWKPGEKVSLFVKNSGYSGTTPFAGKEPGSNGLTL